MILGIHDGHSASAALIDNGRILRFYLEEDLCAIKRQPGFPHLSVKKIIEEYPASDIRIVSFAGKYGRAPLRLFDGLYRKSSPAKDVKSLSSLGYAFYENTIAGLIIIREFERLISRGRLLLQLKKYSLDQKKIVFAEHHLAHAYSAAKDDSEDDFLVMTLDGYGDGISGAVFINSPEGIKVLKKFPVSNSLGLFYGRICNSLGYAEGKEGSFMMLSADAAAGKDDNPFESIFQCSGGNFEIKKQQWGKLIDRLTARTHPDVSRCLQNQLEQTVLKLLDFYLKRYNKRRLYVSGGVFCNSFLFERIAKSKKFSEVKRSCRCDDGGLSIGAAFFAQRMDYE